MAQWRQQHYRRALFVRKTFLLLAMYFMMMLTLQAAGFSNPQDGPQTRASGPAFELFAKEGYLPTSLFGLRSWTRMERARPMDEAGRTRR